jgi:hypothetical protein
MNRDELDLSTEARSAKVDTAIDLVAAAMVTAPDNPELMTRIVSALPERSSRFGWLIPQFVAIGAIVIAGMVWTSRSDRQPAIATLPSAGAPEISGLASAVAAHAPVVAVSAPLEHLEGLERMESTVPVGSDFDRALPFIEVASSLSVADVRPSDIAEPATIDLESIAIADLELTAESFTTQKEE